MIRYFLSLIVVAFLACACSADNEIVETLDINQPEGDSIIIVGINLVGDVSLEEMPLTRGFESNDMIGIHIFQNGESYCFGLFNDLKNLKVALRAGFTYSVQATMIKGADAYMKAYYPSGYSLPPKYFGLSPFRFYYNYYSSGTSRRGYLPKEGESLSINEFVYGKYCHGNILDDGMSYDPTYISTNPGYQSGYCKKIDRFYGEIHDYVPTVNGNIQIPLRRVSFGIKMRVSGLTDGSVSLKCWHNKGTDYIFYNNSSIINDFEGETKIFSLYNIYDAWQYADDGYIEAVKLSVIWTRGNGIVQDLGTKTAYVKRNAVNVFKIKLSTNDTDVDVDVDPEEGDMDTEDEDLSN